MAQLEAVNSNYIVTEELQEANMGKRGASLLQISRRRQLRKLGRALNLIVGRLQGVAKTPSTMH